MKSQYFQDTDTSEEWKHFKARQHLFEEKLPHLNQALAVAFGNTRDTSLYDRAVFLLGSLCCEDFKEIHLLCNYGFGSGALKILRGMYERAVTARWLHSHPKEAENFFNFTWVQQRKSGEAIIRTFGEGFLPREEVEKVKENFERVRHLFQVADCKKCETKKTNHTWSKTDFVSMAAKAGNIGTRVFQAYYLPMRETHPTAAAICSRLKESMDGGLEFDSGPQHLWAENSLKTAHLLILDVLDLQKKHFGLQQLEEPLRVCCEDCREIWGKS